MAEVKRQDHVLQLEGPPGNGVNVGTAVHPAPSLLVSHLRENSSEYLWERDVVDGKANGCGQKTYLRGSQKGQVYYGEYKDGKVWSSIVVKHPDGKHNTIVQLKFNRMIVIKLLCV